VVFVIIIKYFLYFILLSFATWTWFCAMMAVKQAKDTNRLHGTALVFGYALLALGTPLDVILELFSTLIFLELPRYRSNEWLFTARMKRYYHRSITNPNILEKWRFAAGKYITNALLNNISESVGGGYHV
jgi:hypothetical protein